MIILKNSELCVSILHPIDDRAKLGPRFCTGGYVYQVDDHARGPLLSGPEYPSHTPSVINGQGMPDVFQHTLFDDPDDRPEKKLIIGVGLLDNSVKQTSLEQHFALPVDEYCDWKIEEAQGRVTMSTRQSLGGYALALERTVRLEGRRLVSTTRLGNTGAARFRFRWFAHPFFPHPAADETYMPEFPCVLPENPGFFRHEDGSIGLIDSHDWAKGCFLMLPGVEGKIFSIRRHRPESNDLYVEGDFPMLQAALWANEETFSVEPFYDKLLEPGDAAEWSMTYHF